MRNKKKISKKVGTSKNDSFSFVPKMHNTSEECSQATGTKLPCSSHEDNSTCCIPKKDFSEEEFSQASNAKRISSKTLNRSKIRTKNLNFLRKQTLHDRNVETSSVSESLKGDTFSKKCSDQPTIHQKQTLVDGNVQTSNVANRLNNEPLNSDRPDVCIKTHSPQEEYPKISGAAIQSSKVVEQICLRIESLPFLQKNSPFITYSQDEPISVIERNRMTTFDSEFYSRSEFIGERIANYFSFCGQIPDEFVRIEPSPNGQTFEYRPYGQRAVLEDDRLTVNGERDIRFENQNLSSSSGRNNGSNIANERFQNQHLEEIASQLLAISHTNSVEAENLHFKHDQLLHGNSLKSRQLCAETQRNNNDFATKLWAYISYLNRIPCSHSSSYFNINVKMAVAYHWWGIQYYVKNQTESLISVKTFQQKLVDFTQSWNGEESSDLNKFLNYSVMVCQIGVNAKQRKFKKVSSSVINLLRCKIKEIENTRNICFEIVVENYAHEFVKFFGL